MQNYSIDENVLKIVYYLMSADGKIDDSEMNKFNEFGQHYYNYDSEKDSIVNECLAQLDKSFGESDYMDVVKEGVDKCIQYSYLDDEDKRNLVCLLVNMAYANGEYSAEEKQLVRYIVRKLDVDKSYLVEMEDTAKALLALQNKQAWAEDSNMPYNDVKSIISEIESDQKILTDSVRALISMG